MAFIETPTDDAVTPQLLGHTTPESSNAQLSFLIDANDGWHNLRGKKKALVIRYLISKITWDN